AVPDGGLDPAALRHLRVESLDRRVHGRAVSDGRERRQELSVVPVVVWRRRGESGGRERERSEQGETCWRQGDAAVVLSPTRKRGKQREVRDEIPSEAPAHHEHPSSLRSEEHTSELQSLAYIVC